MINGNPNNIKKGDKCILDKGFHNASEVTVVHISKLSGLFATIEHPDVECTWNVMTNRLTKIDTNQNQL